MRISAVCLPLFCVSTEMISNWVPNPIKCFLLSVIGQNRPSLRFLFRRRQPRSLLYSARGDAHATGKNVIFFSAAFRDRVERERWNRAGSIFFPRAPGVCVCSILLAPRRRAPPLSKFTHQNPIHNNHHLAEKSDRVKIWRNGFDRESACASET